MGSFNGSGTFVRTYDWTTDEGNGINIEASRMDTEDDGFATGLSTCITKDGQTTITANIPFNSKKITGLANGSARTDSIALGQVQDNTYGTLGTLGGSADTYTATPTPAITAYAAGMEFNLKVNADNTGASTLNVSSVGAKNIKKYDGGGSKVDLDAGDLQQDQYYKVIYDGTDIVLLNPEAIEKAIINNLILGDGGELTIATGAVTITNSNHTIDTESDAASDDLDTINGGTTGQVLNISNTNSARVVVVKNGTGNIVSLSGDISLENTNQQITLKYDGSNWIAQRQGQVVQIVNYQTGAVATGTTTMPADDTIPQNTEGDEYMTLAITPTSATNKLKIDVVIGYLGTSVDSSSIIALFQDSTANALAASSVDSTAATRSYPSSFSHYMTAGTTSSTTFKVRIGRADAGTTTFNGHGGGRILGGVAASSITITEIQA